MTTQPHFDDSQPRSDDGRFGAKRRAENHLDLVDSSVTGFDAAGRARKCGFQVSDRPAVVINGSAWSCGRCEAVGAEATPGGAESAAIAHSTAEHPDPGGRGFMIAYTTAPQPPQTNTAAPTWSQLGTPTQVTLASFAQSAGARYEPQIDHDTYYSGLVRKGLVVVEETGVARLTEAGWRTLETKDATRRAHGAARLGAEDGGDEPPF